MHFSTIAAPLALLGVAAGSPIEYEAFEERAAYVSPYICTIKDFKPPFTCGINGTFTRPAIVSQAVIDRPAVATTESHCHDVCYTNAKCLTYSFDNSKSACTIYNRTLTDMGIKASNSPIINYNIHCMDCKLKPTCTDKPGLAFAYYQDNTIPLNLPTDPNYSAFDPSDYKTVRPNYQGTTQTLGFNAGILNLSPFKVYGHPSGPNNFVINHRGFIKSPAGGTYTIRTKGTDDVVYVWVGDIARTGYTQTNSAFQSAAFAEQQAIILPGQKSGSINLVAGYNPIRIVYAQSLGAANLNLTITDPQGKGVVGPKGAFANIVQASCGNTVPAFPNFGAET